MKFLRKQGKTEEQTINKPVVPTPMVNPPRVEKIIVNNGNLVSNKNLSDLSNVSEARINLDCIKFRLFEIFLIWLNMFE